MSAQAPVSAAVRRAGSKMAALALLAAVVAGVTFGIVVPMFERFRDLDDKIASQRALLGRFMTASTANAEPQDGLSQTAIEQTYLAGETDALRLASLQATLNDVAAAQKIRFASTRAMDAVDQSSVRLLGLQVQVSTDLATLQKMLFDVEKSRQNMIVDALHITRAPESAANVPPLDVSFVLLGAAPKKKD